MNSEAARGWLRDHCSVSRETFDKLDLLYRATLAESEKQNLIAASTIEHFWTRHIVDSAQLIRFAGHGEDWIDLGSGAGFPGLVVALLTARRVTLAEERRKRADHLEAMIDLLDIGYSTTVLRGRVEQQSAGPFTTVSARAFAPLERLFRTSHHLSSPNTIWVLPKGRSAASELEAAQRTWQGSFRIEPSITDPDGAIIVATGVQPRRRR